MEGGLQACSPSSLSAAVSCGLSEGEGQEGSFQCKYPACHGWYNHRGQGPGAHWSLPVTQARQGPQLLGPYTRQIPQGWVHTSFPCPVALSKVGPTLPLNRERSQKHSH